MLASRTPDKFERLSKRTANERVKPRARLPQAKIWPDAPAKYGAKWQIQSVVAVIF
jgi:hypothetical protein